LRDDVWHRTESIDRRNAYILFELWSGRDYENNYLTWLTSWATGLGILFALRAPSISKSKGDRIVSRVFKFILGKNIYIFKLNKCHSREYVEGSNYLQIYRIPKRED
jgi:hypothetical protein